MTIALIATGIVSFVFIAARFAARVAVKEPAESRVK